MTFCIAGAWRIIFIVLLIFGCSTPSTEEPTDENTMKYCQDDIDNDSDNLVDCDDQDCSVFVVCNDENGKDSSGSLTTENDDGTPNAESDPSGDNDTDSATLVATNMDTDSDTGTERSVGSIDTAKERDSDSSADVDTHTDTDADSDTDTDADTDTDTDTDASADTDTDVDSRVDGGPSECTQFIVTPDTATVVAGGTVSLTAICVIDGKLTPVGMNADWSSDNESVATVELGEVTGVTAGEATISATYGGHQESAVVTVAPIEVAAVRIEPNDEVLAEYLAEVTYTATCAYSDDTTDNCTDLVEWSSSDEEVATIDENGVATAIAQGMTTIRAAIENIEASTTLTVSWDAPCDAIIVATGGQRREMRIGDSLQLTATCQIGDAFSIVTDMVEFTFDNNDCILLSEDVSGLVTALAVTPLDTPVVVTASYSNADGTTTVGTIELTVAR